MTSDEWLTFNYPYFSNVNDQRYVDSAIRAQALAVALTKTPNCELMLAGSELHNEAVSYQAAHILDTRYKDNSFGAIPGGMVITREKEGEVEREYAKQDLTNSEASTSPFERFKELANLCPQNSGFSLKVRRA